MFGQKKTSRSSTGQKKHDLGMFLDPTMGMGNMEDGEDDGDLEAELAALQGHQPRKKPPKPKQKLMAMTDIDKLAADCMKDVDDISDDDLEDPDLLAELEGLDPMESDASFDDTPSLVPTSASSDSTSAKNNDVKVISNRKAMYETAIANAEKAGEGSKARRYKRGLKDIEKLLKAAEAGKAVSMEELPPPVAIGVDKPAPSSSPTPVPLVPPSSTSVPEKPLIDLGPSSGPKSSADVVAPKSRPIPPDVPGKPAALERSAKRAAPEIPAKPVAPERPAKPPAPGIPQKPSAPEKPKNRGEVRTPEPAVIKELTLKRNQYKLAARNSNRDGDKEQAKTYLLISKEFDLVIQAVAEGKEVDLSQCPPPPPGFPGGPDTKPSPAASSAQSSGTTGPEVQSSSTSASSDDASQAAGPPPVPKTALEALEQRLEKYQSGLDDAKKEGNSSKARRMGRIVKQYQDAIRDYKAKKPVNLEELPVPPGYAPIPTESPPSQPTPTPRKVASDPARQLPAQQPPAKPPSAKQAPVATRPPRGTQPPAAEKPAPKGRNEKELQFLIGRQKAFRTAALNAKKQDDLEAARKHLKAAKGFDAMIEAARNGLRVDLTKVPEPPGLGLSFGPADSPVDNDFVTVLEEDCSADVSNREEVFASLEKTLKHQYEMCKRNNQHYSKLGDIENSKRFEKLGLNCKRDYESLQNAFKHGNPPPRYHYENRTFTIIRSNTDLGDQDCELTIVKCINIPLPSGYTKDDMKVYVTYEFPFPNDQPQTGYTETIRHSINPEFKQSFKLSIDRKNRSLARTFRRHGVKFEVKYARGFLKGDKSLGQASVKLGTFDNKTEIHECVDLMDPEKGRKAIGGKIEVKLRIREPLTDKDVEILTEKWLVIDAFVVPSNRPISASSTKKVDNRTGNSKTKGANASKVCCIE